MENNLVENIFKEKFTYWKNQSIKNNTQFVDSLFPPNKNSILGTNEKGEYFDKINGEKNAAKLEKLSIKWAKPEEIFINKKYYLFEERENINISDIKQGNIDDCYFISSIIGLSKEPNIIFNLFKTKEKNPNGFYEIIFFIEGKYQIIIIDDYLPVFENNELCFGKSLKNEIWVSLLEKAWAKVNGGYANIIKGFAHHTLETLTGFPCINLIHSSLDFNYIWDYIINSFRNKSLITSTSKNEINSKLIESNHSYTLIEYCIINKIKVIKLRDPKKIINKFKSNKIFPFLLDEEKLKMEKDYEKGIIYLTFEDYYNNFSFTNICFIFNNNHSQIFKIEKNDIFKGNIFNIYLEKDSVFSINLIKRNGIFHTNMVKNNLPSFIYLVKYNPDNIENFDFNRIINNYNDPFFCDFISNINSKENVSIIKELKKGYYLFYSFVNYNCSLLDLDNYYYLKFDSFYELKIQKKPCDIKENDFPILKNIKIHEYLFTNKIKNFENGINYVIKFRNNDLVMKIIYNNNNKWLKIIEDCSEMKNIILLSPFQIKDKNFIWYVPPKKFNIIIGMIIDSSLNGNFILKSKNFLIKSVPINFKNYEINNISKYINNNFK